MDTPVFIVAFTGNRPKDESGRRPEDLEAMRPRIRILLQNLRETAAKRGGIIHFYSSVAEGADTIACEVALDLGVPLHLILPLPVEQFRMDFEDSPDAWDRSLHLIEHASSPDSDGSVRVARGNTSRPDCYTEANHELLELANVVLAVTNLNQTGMTGGSAEVLATAKSRNIDVIVLNTLETEDAPLSPNLLRAEP